MNVERYYQINKVMKVYKDFKYGIIISLLLVAVLLELFSLIKPEKIELKKINITDSKILNQYADNIIGICAKGSDRPSCYDQEIPKLMDNLSMEDTFRVTGIIQSKDQGYPYCHVLGHELSAREVAKDPSKWKEVITKCPAGFCSNGCLHGGLQERYRGVDAYNEEQLKEVVEDLSDICEKRGSWNPTGLEQASCYHAVGHLAMYLAFADLDKSGDICRKVAVKDDGRNFLKTCYDGNFMQLFQPLESEDKELIAGKEVGKNDLESFCFKFSLDQRESCWHEGWPLYIQEILTPQGLVNYCNNPILTSEAHRNRCFLSLFYVIPVQLRFDISKIKNYCSGLEGNIMDQCFANTASRLIETDYRNIGLSSNYCSQAPTETARNACYNELIFYSTFNFHPRSKEFYDLCNTLPANFKERCLSGAKLQ